MRRDVHVALASAWTPSPCSATGPLCAGRGKSIDESRAIISREESMANSLGRANRSSSLVRSSPGANSPVRRAIVRARQWAGSLALAFVALAVLVAAGATEGIDEWFSRLATALAWYPADVAASAFGILGRAEVTGPLALALAFLWWRRDGARGLVPLLLFAGIAIEVALKHAIPHPGPPADISRGVSLLPMLK